jgi:hypothetical protein
MAINANFLRKLAEHADGLRAERLRVVLSNEKKKSSRKPIIGPIDAAEYLFEMRTPHANNKKMGRPASVKIGYGVGKKPLAIFPGSEKKPYFDSLFWTQSAIEKFVVPYYARIFTPTEMAKLRKAYTNENVVAIGHRYPTIYEEIDGSSFEPFGEVKPKPVKKKQVNPELFRVLLVLADGTITSLADFKP